MENPERCSHWGRHEKRLWLLLFFALIIVTGISTNPGKAAGVSPARDIADGRPWKMTMDDGRAGTLVLFQNGTGKMNSGLLELSPKWRPTPDGLCLKPGALLPERCVKLVRSGNLYVGVRAGKQTFKLER
ncbi:hypothetical protein P9272_02695 [Mesorhizobium sp. WSM4976]|uniref:hypothetical protein n=1 Tax=Mesorhizobium sp. WSM4976 TaxID=3038549 RepID=UPI0024166283|nr:hypothetical protein [Mesorhizobium sp. WSM4976]MDG4892505.1 hypothetical protein [Mesorhizobium sp. WSM4976]